nr:hypothetical protein [Tanacetum cinerariifolium]
AIGLGLILAAQAFEIVPDNAVVDSALQGAGVIATMQTVRQYSGANSPAGAAAQSGLVSVINKYVPGFADSAVAPAPATTPTGTQGIGSLTPYRDPAAAALLAGNYQRQLAAAGGSLQNLGAAPARVTVLQNLG